MSDHVLIEQIERRIFVFRDEKVMIDRHLAELYGVETRVLKQAVRRNIQRFPQDFMFVLTKKEFANWRSQFVISNVDKMGLRDPPMVFTEQGVLNKFRIMNAEGKEMKNSECRVRNEKNHNSKI